MDNDRLEFFEWVSIGDNRSAAPQNKILRERKYISLFKSRLDQL
jgi:hypothetical protein